MRRRRVTARLLRRPGHSQQRQQLRAVLVRSGVLLVRVRCVFLQRRVGHVRCVPRSDGVHGRRRAARIVPSRRSIDGWRPIIHLHRMPPWLHVWRVPSWQLLPGCSHIDRLLRGHLQRRRLNVLLSVCLLASVRIPLAGLVIVRGEGRHVLAVPGRLHRLRRQRRAAAAVLVRGRLRVLRARLCLLQWRAGLLQRLRRRCECVSWRRDAAAVCLCALV